MKRQYRLFVIALIASQLALMSAFAQPAWVKKATKSVFTLKTFDDQGALLGSANGFFVGEQGEAVSSFSPFRGAARAVVIDAAGKELPVECMLGANDTYDVAKFRVASRKTPALPLAVATAPVGSTAWLLPYRELKNCPQGTVSKAETFRGDYAYYTVSLVMPDQTVGSPLLNEAGEVVGLMQQPYKASDTLSYAVSARFADSLAISGLSINDPTLRATSIKKDLPTSLEQALLTLYVGSSALDSVAYVQLLEDFIQRFPNAAEGYTYRAQMEASANKFDAASRDMELAIKVAEKKDDAHYNYSRLIYQKEIYKSDVSYAPWSLDKALAEAEAAYAVNPEPLYRHQQAYILYAQKKYAEAYAVYEQLFGTSQRNADLFYEASRCQEMLSDTTAQLAMLDSCVATFSRPYLKEAAPYLIARAQARLSAGKYRDAVADFNEYEQLMPTGLAANFYYLRHQADLGGRLFQQALNDISRAIELAPDNDLYYAEKASLQIRVGQYDEAIETARECVRLSPDTSDGYLFLGLAQCLKGNKAEGVGHLQKAKELGDQQADGLIEKYGK